MLKKAASSGRFVSARVKEAEIMEIVDNLLEMKRCYLDEANSSVDSEQVSNELSMIDMDEKSVRFVSRGLCSFLKNPSKSIPDTSIGVSSTLGK